MIKTHNLKSRTFSKKAKLEIFNIIPNARTSKKLHVAGIGYVLFIKNENQKTIAHCHKEICHHEGIFFSGLKLFVK